MNDKHSRKSAELKREGHFLLSRQLLKPGNKQRQCTWILQHHFYRALICELFKVIDEISGSTIDRHLLRELFGYLL